MGWLILILLFVSCSVPVLETPPEQDLILWDITSADIPDTKALVNSYVTLRNACTQDEDGAEKIGLWGSYALDGATETIFSDADLWWWEKEDGNPFDDVLGNPSMWNYEGEGKRWVTGADYVFRAYFPKSMVTLQPGSDMDRFLVVYDTQVSQFDMMVASRELKAGSENPVKLIFGHALSAIRFDFQFVEEGVKDNLIACWLENAESGGFYTSSTLNYEESVVWPSSTPYPVGNRMYYWEPSEPLLIESGTAATAYASSAPAGSGDIYTGNEGWVLAIPQKMHGPAALKLCFRTSTGGNTVFSVGLPEGNLEAGSRYTFHIKISSTSIDLDLTIADWNERKSSHYIDMNE